LFAGQYAEAGGVKPTGDEKADGGVGPVHFASEVGDEPGVALFSEVVEILKWFQNPESSVPLPEA
jgi:hypothetical protein